MPIRERNINASQLIEKLAVQSLTYGWKQKVEGINWAIIIKLT